MTILAAAIDAATEYAFAVSWALITGDWGAVAKAHTDLHRTAASLGRQSIAIRAQADDDLEFYGPPL